MANAFDLEEQEQLAQLKHFWNRHGNWITWLVIAVLASFTGWNTWQYWQNKKGAEASALFDELDRAVNNRQLDRVQLSLSDLQSQYAGTLLAQQGALLAAKGWVNGGDLDKARAALEWAAKSGADASLKSVARLRLSALAMEQQKWDEAAQWVKEGLEPEFQALAADRMGDIHLAQGRKSEARDAFLKAYAQMGPEVEYRRLVAVKLNALGVDPERAPKS